MIYNTVLLYAKSYLIKKNETIKNLVYKINNGTFDYNHTERIKFREEIKKQINKTTDEVLISESIEDEEEKTAFKIATDYLIYAKLDNLFSDTSALEKFISGLEDTEKTEYEPVS